ncbi:MAG: alanine racemase [Eubacteriales bacterium]|nr:alanine racemase [Eubacteriales bacterium]
MECYSRVYAAIHMDAILENLGKMRANIREETQMIAVIKTDGYGHGAAEIARHAEPLPYLWGYAVATADEALALRSAGLKKPILILGYTFQEHYEELVSHEIRPVVFQYESARKLSEAAKKLGKTALVHLAVDTGMSRIGVKDDASSVAEVVRISQLPNLSIEGIFTHFARADEADKTEANRQIARFTDYIRRLEEAGVKIPLHHCSNSAGILELPQANMDLVRAGITLYGIYPSDEVSREMGLSPVMELKSHIVYIKDLEAGAAVSYGGTFVADGPMRVATIPVGYGDGYPRSLSNKGWVLIHGKKARILGRVCMDQMMVDVTEIPEAQELDEVTLMGNDRGATLSVETLGALSGRFPYEFVCDIGKRVPRVFDEHGKVYKVENYLRQSAE